MLTHPPISSPKRRRPLQFEALEQRRLLAGDLALPPLDKAFIDHGPSKPEPEVVLASESSEPSTKTTTALPQAAAGAIGGSVADLIDDQFEENDRRRQSAYLGRLTGTQVFNGLRMSDRSDWYRFRVARRMGRDAALTVGFENGLGDIDVALFNSKGRLLRNSVGVTDVETISLSELRAGNYYIRVYGYQGALNPSYSLSIATGLEGGDDRFENNDRRSQAQNLGRSAASRQYDNLVMADNSDWYQFNLTQRGGAESSAQILFDHSQGDLDVALFNRNGRRVRFSASVSDNESISLNGLRGIYYLRVYGYQGVHNPSYSLQLNPRTQMDDRYEENDTLGTAANLGAVNGQLSVSNLAVQDEDWYRFALPSTAPSDASVQVTFQHSQGDLDIALYDASGNLLDNAVSTTDNESISLAGRAAGNYYLLVYGYGGAENPSYAIDVVSNSQDDAFEENDSSSSPADLGAFAGSRNYSNLRMADAADWYRFTTQGTGQASNQVSIAFDHGLGDLDIVLYDASGSEVGRSTGTGNSESISLSGLPAGAYRLYVYGYRGVQNPNYSLSIFAPDGDDAYEQNDSRGAAASWGTLDSRSTFSNLILADAADWYSFTTTRTGTSDSEFNVLFSHRAGDIDVELYDSAGSRLRTATSADDNERLSLDGLPGGTYYLRVYGYQGATNPAYEVDFNPGTDSTPGTSSTLYLNFDGQTLSRSELLRWSSDWSIPLNSLATGSVTVSPFLQGTQYADQREAIISEILRLVRADLQPFGITVERWTGAAVENVGATTIFLGRSTGLNEGLYHVACDVDFGNNNGTDIAFVGNEAWSSANATALALADVTLHEAGHTFGLYHVNSRVNGTVYNESMGLRYTAQNQSNWVRNTAFLNRTFQEYQNHGGNRGPQNTYQTMLANFNANPAAAPDPGAVAAYASDPSGIFTIWGSDSADRVAVEQLGDDVTLILNGQIFHLLDGIQSVRIYTQGDAEDQIRIASDLSIEVVVDLSKSGGWSNTTKSPSYEVLQAEWLDHFLEDHHGLPRQSPLPDWAPPIIARGFEQAETTEGGFETTVEPRGEVTEIARTDEAIANWRPEVAPLPLAVPASKQGLSRIANQVWRHFDRENWRFAELLVSEPDSLGSLRDLDIQRR